MRVLEDYATKTKRAIQFNEELAVFNYFKYKVLCYLFGRLNGLLLFLFLFVLLTNILVIIIIISIE